jgi:hypothetical protein
MARIKAVSIGKTRSVKVADYQYFKPMVILEAELEEGDAVNEVATDLSIQCDMMLTELEDLEQTRFANVLRRRELEEVMEEHSPSDTEYKLAQKALEAMNKGELI